MKLRVYLALLSLALLVGPASAQLLNFSGNDKKKDGPAPGQGPFSVGPWYNYWPLEAHFQVPAVPQYPFWGAPMTLPVAPPAPYQATPVQGMPGAGGFQGMQQLPFAAPGAMPGMGMPGAGHPGMGMMAPGGYPGAGMPAQGMPGMGMPGMGMPGAPAMGAMPGMGMPGMGMPGMGMPSMGMPGMMPYQGAPTYPTAIPAPNVPRGPAVMPYPNWQMPRQ